MGKLSWIVCGASVLGLGLASTASAEEVTVCVGDSFVVEATKGSTLSYTQPGFAGGYPNMYTEALVAEKARVDVGDGSIEYLVLPGADAFFTESGGSLWDAEKAAEFDGPAYHDLISSEANRIAIKAHEVGSGLVRYWERSSDGFFFSHELMVNVEQCGASSAVNSTSLTYMCEGSARVFKRPTSLRSSNSDTIYIFRGRMTGTDVVSGVRPGRSLLIPREGRGLRGATSARVGAEGSARCASADGVSLESSGEGARRGFHLQVCAGDVWVSPTSELTGVSSVVGFGSSVTAEQAVDGSGFAIWAEGRGYAEVLVKYAHPDAMPSTIGVSVIDCD